VLLQRLYACCEAVLQSSSEQWGLLFANSNAQMHWCWVTAHLYGQQIIISVIAETQCML